MLKSLGPSAKISTQVVFIQKCELSEMSGGYGVASREKSAKQLQIGAATLRATGREPANLLGVLGESNGLSA